MVSQIKSRTQRRMEKKQALVLLILVLAVSLVSFSLGVMVGRSGTAAAVAKAKAAAAVPTRMPVAQQTPAPAVPDTAAATSQPAKEKLTFYETLPKGTQPPMGSGINLPPGQKSAEKEPVAVPPPASPKTAPKAAALPPGPAAAVPPPAKKSASAPAVKRAGTRVVQVASFRRAQEAEALRQRLVKKGYAAYIREVDLGAKGRWERVFVGPFASADEADRVAARLKAEEKLSALVKKR